MHEEKAKHYVHNFWSVLITSFTAKWPKCLLWVLEYRYFLLVQVVPCRPVGERERNNGRWKVWWHSKWLETWKELKFDSRGIIEISLNHSYNQLGLFYGKYGTSLTNISPNSQTYTSARPYSYKYILVYYQVLNLQYIFLGGKIGIKHICGNTRSNNPSNKFMHQHAICHPTSWVFWYSRKMYRVTSLMVIMVILTGPPLPPGGPGGPGIKSWEGEEEKAKMLDEASKIGQR